MQLSGGSGKDAATHNVNFRGIGRRIAVALDAISYSFSD